MRVVDEATLGDRGPHLREEVQQEISPQYWKYVAQKVKALEQAWKGFNLQETKQ
jgi:hypothetical protein